MQTTARQPVLSQRIERRSSGTTGYLADLRAWYRGKLCPQGWISICVAQEPDADLAPFAAVGHEHRITARPSGSRELDDDDIRPLVGTSTAERYCGPRGRLLNFKKSR